MASKLEFSDSVSNQERLWASIRVLSKKAKKQTSDVRDKRETSSLIMTERRNIRKNILRNYLIQR